jgi:hypothetical protein
MFMNKTDIVATLRSRGLDAKADFVDRQLPPLVDTQTNRALLEMLGIAADLPRAETIEHR